MNDLSIPVTVWSYTAGESIEYMCSLCGTWVVATVIEIQPSPEKIIINHDGERIGVYYDELSNIRKVASTC